MIVTEVKDTKNRRRPLSPAQKEAAWGRILESLKTLCEKEGLILSISSPRGQDLRITKEGASTQGYSIPPEWEPMDATALMGRIDSLNSLQRAVSRARHGFKRGPVKELAIEEWLQAELAEKPPPKPPISDAPYHPPIPPIAQEEKHQDTRRRTWGIVALLLAAWGGSVALSYWSGVTAERSSHTRLQPSGLNGG